MRQTDDLFPRQLKFLAQGGGAAQAIGRRFAAIAGGYRSRTCDRKASALVAALMCVFNRGADAAHRHPRFSATGLWRLRTPANLKHFVYVLEANIRGACGI